MNADSPDGGGLLEPMQTQKSKQHVDQANEMPALFGKGPPQSQAASRVGISVRAAPGQKSQQAPWEQQGTSC